MRRILPTILAIAALSPVAGRAATRVVGAAEFKSWNADHHYFEYAGGFLHGIGGVTTGCLSAPLDIPKGSVLHSLTGHFYDNHAGYDFSVDLLRKRRGNFVVAEPLAGVGTVGENPGIVSPVDSTISSPVVDTAYIYYLLTSNCMDGDQQRLYDVVLDLDEAIFLDGFESGNTNAWSPATVLRSLWVQGASFSSKFEPGWPRNFSPEWGTVSRVYDGVSTPPCLVAPVELPNGVTVTAVLADLYDDRSDRGIELTIRRAPMNSAVVPTTLATITSTIAYTSGWHVGSDGTIDNATIDNSTYWYWAEMCITGGDTLGAVDELTQAVQIVYTLP